MHVTMQHINRVVRPYTYWCVCEKPKNIGCLPALVLHGRGPPEWSVGGLSRDRGFNHIRTCLRLRMEVVHIPLPPGAIKIAELKRKCESAKTSPVILRYSGR